jgi:hypothetical protein
MPKVKTVTSIIDNNRFVFTCEEDAAGEFLDTKVELNGMLLCWITWGNHEIFIKDFSAWIGKYRI